MNLINNPTLEPHILPVIKKGIKYPKGWGYELHIENNDDYCSKLLVFDKGKKFSMHYHVTKYETWYVQKGKLNFNWIDPDTADIITNKLEEGDIVTLYQGIAHQLEALEDSIIFEASIHDEIKDSYRVFKGDSQK